MKLMTMRGQVIITIISLVGVNAFTSDDQLPSLSDYVPSADDDVMSELHDRLESGSVMDQLHDQLPASLMREADKITKTISWDPVDDGEISDDQGELNPTELGETSHEDSKDSAGYDPANTESYQNKNKKEANHDQGQESMALPKLARKPKKTPCTPPDSVECFVQKHMDIIEEDANQMYPSENPVDQQHHEGQPHKTDDKQQEKTPKPAAAGILTQEAESYHHAVHGTKPSENHAAKAANGTPEHSRE